jgi:2-acylglycerol O-acyltransferase 2
VGKGKLGEELRTKEGSNQSKTKQQQQQQRPTFYSFASARERYSSLRKGFEDWWLVVLFYCPHYLTLCAVLIPYLCLPILYASSIMMGVYLPLHLWGLIGQPQQTGLRESKTFLKWSGTTFEKICSRFLGGVTCICDYDCCEGEKNSSGRRIADVGDGNKYIFAYHPHALYPLGLVFYHRLAEFRRHFGQIRPIPLVASVIFRLPILGQLACRAGVREVTGSVFRKALRDRGAVTLVPGGQAELCVAPRAHSDKDPEIVLNTRHKGFIKIALQTGAHLVPVFCFGEIYQLKNGLCFPRLQAWTYKQFGFPVPFLPVGRFGIPFPLNSRQTGHPFTFVVGRPMKVDQVMPEGRPVTQEEIDQTHAKYFSRVEKLFHKYKKQCGYQDKALVLEDK